MEKIIVNKIRCKKCGDEIESTHRHDFKLYKSNPTLFEWFSSPIVYLETDFADRFRHMMGHYFSSKKTLYHYISMAEGNYREYLKGDMVRAKKYFYVLRPVLACRWVMDRGTPPPMLFSELMLF